MAGDPICDNFDYCTVIATTATTETYYSGSNSSYYTVYSNYYSDEIERKIKKLLHLKVIKDMKDKWHTYKKDVIIYKLRPNIQLRGVYLRGHGWA